MADFTKEDYRDMAIAEVCRVPNELRPKIMLMYADFLHGVDFICVDDENGHDVVSPVTNLFSSGEISSLFYSNNLRVLNLDFLSRKKSKFWYHYNLMLDTQMVSYIERLLRKGSLEKPLLDKVKALQIQTDFSFTFNMTPYIMENCLFKESIDDETITSIRSSLYFFYEKVTPPKRAKQLAEKQTKEIIADYSNLSYAICKHEERYYYSYCTLLKIVLLSFIKGNIKQKMEDFIHFQNYDTCTCDTFSQILALEFWRRGTQFSFFSKIQKGNRDLIKNIKNMAWDFFHIISAQLNFSYILEEQADINMPLFCTADKRLQDLCKITKLQCVAVDHINHTANPVYENSALNELFSWEEQRELFGAKALHYRNQNRKNVNTKILSECLEEELRKIQDA